MNTKQTTGIISAVIVIALSVVTLFAPSVLAEDKGNNGCGVDTSLINCNNVDINADDKIQTTGVWSLLLTAINILTAGIGVVALGGVVYGSVLYTTAGGKQEQIKKATTIFTNVVIGVLAYAGMYAVLNFLIPGGIFSA